MFHCYRSDFLLSSHVLHVWSIEASAVVPRGHVTWISLAKKIPWNPPIDQGKPMIWVNFITTEACSPEAWNHG